MGKERLAAAIKKVEKDAGIKIDGPTAKLGQECIFMSYIDTACTAAFDLHEITRFSDEALLSLVKDRVFAALDDERKLIEAALDKLREDTGD